MPSYSVDDFKPSDFKRLQRINVVRKTAEIRVKTYNLIAQRDFLCERAVVLKEDGIEKFADRYFSSIAQFKLRQSYAPHQRINQEKICAFLLKTCAEGKWDDIFGRHQDSIGHNSISDDFMEKLYNEFSFTLVCAFAGVQSNATASGNLERDFQICMHRHHFMPDEWACLMMTAFVKAFGSPIGCEE
ncbi:hypothetical protein [Azospirillum largimobile]